MVGQIVGVGKISENLGGEASLMPLTATLPKILMTLLTYRIPFQRRLALRTPFAERQTHAPCAPYYYNRSPC